MKIEKYIKNYIDGTFTPSVNEQYLNNINPATGQVYSLLPDSEAADIDKAVEAAERAFPSWSSSGLNKRYRILNRLADIIEQNVEAFAKAETIDMGMPITMSSTLEVPLAHKILRFYATRQLHTKTNAHYKENEAISYQFQQPHGVVGIITPSNLPLQILLSKIAPALAVGNCVVAKPSEIAPMSAFLLAKACQEAGLPPGVINIVQGEGSKAGQALVIHPQVRAIAFAGKTSTGKEIAKEAAPLFKALSLDLGAKNTSIIFADCDFDKAVIGTLKSAFSNNGQLSWSTPKILVEHSLYEKFKNELVKRTQFLKVTDPQSPIADLGAIASQSQIENLKSYMALAKIEGAKICCGGEALALEGSLQKGNFWKPTVLENVPIDSRINQEEIFAPLVTIAPFDSEHEAISLANNSPYGKAACIWTKDITRANRLAENLQVASVWINAWRLQDFRTPSNALKASGLNKHSEIDTIGFFTYIKNISTKY